MRAVRGLGVSVAGLDRVPWVSYSLEKLTRGLFGTSVLLRCGADPAFSPPVGREPDDVRKKWGGEKLVEPRCVSRSGGPDLLMSKVRVKLAPALL